MLKGLIYFLAILAAQIIGGAPDLKAKSEAASPFTIVAMSDAPYTDILDFTQFSSLLSTINALDPAFTVHVGDFKNGSGRCTNRSLTMIKEYFDDLKGADL